MVLEEDNEMIQGLLLTAAGIFLTVAALVGALVMSVTGKGQRRKLEERMKEVYYEI